MSDVDTEIIAFRMRILEGKAAEYKRRHDEIWDELEKLLCESGIIDYSIWLDEETRYLFAQLTRRKNHNMDALPKQLIMKKWWAYMADIMEVEADQSPTQQSLQPMYSMRAMQNEGDQHA